MKVWLLIVFDLLFCLLIAHAQSYEYMYKKQPVHDSDISNKTNERYRNSTTADSVDTAQVIGFAITPLYKKQPESPLGNFMADGMKYYAEKMYNKTIDAAFVNFGSMRFYIPKGDITISMLYKVMPYENKIILLAIPGAILKQFLDHQASLGGWPCAGITMTIENKKATDILINNQPFDEAKTYSIAVTDYIANGGNQCIMLKGLQQINNRYLFSNALVDYVASFTKAGKPVAAAIENRIVYRNE